MSNKMSLMPNISIPRSRFKQSFNHSLDMFHGDVVPVDCFEVLPGDEFSYKLASLIRMSTPIVPIMGNIKACLHAFFVPMRLIWDDTEKFFGDPSNHDKVSTITPVDPATIYTPYVSENLLDSNIPFKRSVQDYLGKVDLNAVRGHSPFSDTEWKAYLEKLHLNTFKELAYLCIWNDHFRPSLMVPPVVLSKTLSKPLVYGTNTFLDSTQTALKYPFKPLKGFKQYDYFTSATLAPYYSANNINLPLGTFAPVGAIAKATDEAVSANLNMERYDYVSGKFYQARVGNSTSGVWNNAYAIADLSEALNVSWNDVRYCAQLTKFAERSNYGNRFFEILNAHYGITNPDSRLQRAERLGSHEFYINISQVVSTADTVSGDNGQNLGNTGAVSCTGDTCHLFTKSFSEPGFVMVVITTKYDRSYASGLLREDMRKDKFSYYFPEFANLGDQATKKVEIQLFDENGDIVDPDTPFGYQEHWAEYRYRKDLVSGGLRPNGGFDIWTLADDFDDQIAFPGYAFLKEDRASLARVLSTGTNGPDYICDFRANIIATREMPLYSIPGLIDHFGAL